MIDNRIVIVPDEYANLLSFACDRSSPQYTIDAITALDLGWDELDQAVSLGERWEELRDEWNFPHGEAEVPLMGRRRKELVDQVYRTE